MSSSISNLHHILLHNKIITYYYRKLTSKLKQSGLALHDESELDHIRDLKRVKRFFLTHISITTNLRKT